MNRKAMKIIAIAAGAVLAVIVLLPYVVDMDRFRPELEASLGTSLQREVHLGHMQLSLLSGGARVDQISVADDPSFRNGSFLDAKSLGVGMNLFSLLFSRSMHITSLNLSEPHITLVQSAEGKWNFSTLGAAVGDTGESAVSTTLVEPSARTFVLDRLTISKAILDVGYAQGGKPSTFKDVNLELKNVSLASAMSFALSAQTTSGKFELRGEAGPISQSDTTQVPFHATITAGSGNATLSGDLQPKGADSTVQVKIVGNHLPLDNVVGVLPALGISLPGGSKLHGGTISAHLSVTGPVNRLVTTGSAQIANAHLAGFDLGSKMSSFPGAGALKSGPELSIISLGSSLHISPERVHISGFDGQFAGIGSITGGGDVTTDNHLQFQMVAHISGDGALRFGLNHVGLKNVPNEIPFRVIGTTAAPILVPDLSGMARNTAKMAAATEGKSMLKRILPVEAKNGKGPAETKGKPEHQKEGFFHTLFHRKNKDGKNAHGTQLAAEKSKF